MRTDVAIPRILTTGLSSASLSANFCPFDDMAYPVVQFSSEGGPVFRADCRPVGFSSWRSFTAQDAHSTHGDSQCTPGMFDHIARDGRLHPMAAHPKKVTSHS